MLLTDDTTNHFSNNLAFKEIEKEDNYVFYSSLSFPHAVRLLQLLFLFPLSHKMKHFFLPYIHLLSSQSSLSHATSNAFPSKTWLSELVKTCYCFCLQTSCNINAQP